MQQEIVETYNGVGRMTCDEDSDSYKRFSCRMVTQENGHQLAEVDDIIVDAPKNVHINGRGTTSITFLPKKDNDLWQCDVVDRGYTELHCTTE